MLYPAEHVCRLTFDFRKADWPNLTPYLDSIDYFSLFENCADTESVFSTFYSVLYNSFNEFVPLRKSVSSRSHACYLYRIRELLRKEVRLWRIYKRLKTTVTLHKYSLIAPECRSAIYTFHVERENRIIEFENAGKYFSYANRKFTCKFSMRPLRTSDESLITDSVRKTELF